MFDENRKIKTLFFDAFSLHYTASANPLSLVQAMDKFVYFCFDAQVTFAPFHNYCCYEKNFLSFLFFCNCCYKLLAKQTQSGASAIGFAYLLSFRVKYKFTNQTFLGAGFDYFGTNKIRFKNVIQIMSMVTSVANGLYSATEEKFTSNAF